ncbi:MAG: DUF1641 domain-containing protein [Desulfopila sp.]|nr:DUF1641 domain-containing protein [Desulfopila sp.]
MTNEEKILERLDQLTEEVREAKQAIRPYAELKEELQPLFNEMIISATGKLDGLGRRFDLEDVVDMIGQLLISSKNMTEALKALNKFIEFKNDFMPYSKDVFKELTEQLQKSLHGFEPEELQELIRQFIVNMGNIAEGLKMLGSLMDLKKEAATLSKLAFNDSIERLETLKNRGAFESFEQLLFVTERIGARMQQVDFEHIRPIRGVWGMMSAMKRPEVQEGLGILVELSTVMTALKREPVVQKDCLVSG